MLKLGEVFKMTDPLVELVKREAAKEVAKEVDKAKKESVLETAKKMLVENAGIDFIAKVTNLSVMEIQELQQQL